MVLWSFPRAKKNRAWQAGVDQFLCQLIVRQKSPVPSARRCNSGFQISVIGIIIKRTRANWPRDKTHALWNLLRIAAAPPLGPRLGREAHPRGARAGGTGRPAGLR